jgi:hypothetical protein
LQKFAKNVFQGGFFLKSTVHVHHKTDKVD